MTEKNFEGHQPRHCSEHHTVGPHRAWCLSCTEWCYPDMEAACAGCQVPFLIRRALDLRADLELLQRKVDQLTADAEGFETYIEYGYMTTAAGWVPEPRGINYATHQRQVTVRYGPPQWAQEAQR